jgi:hypothetical protein
MAKAADHRSAIANRHVSDMLHGLGDEWIELPHSGIELYFSMSRHRFYDDLIALYGDAFEAFDMLDVDQKGWRCDAKIHRGNKTLTAGQNHRIGVAGKNGDGVPKGPWGLVPKQWRLHLQAVLPWHVYPRLEYDIYITDELSINRRGSMAFAQ